MAFDPDLLDSLDDGQAEPDPPDEFDDELEGVPATWDLMSGRAAAHRPRLIPVDELDVAAFVDLVLDGVQPNGAPADGRLRAATLAAWRTREPRLSEALYVALTGKTPAGEQVDAERQVKARGYAEARRLAWLEPEQRERPARPSRRGRLPASAHAVKVTGADGSRRFEQLGNDEAAIAQAAVELSGRSLEELRAAARPGPKNAAEKELAARRALVVHRLVDECGATQEAVGRVLGLSKQRVSQLAAVGARLLKRLAGGR